MKEEIQSQVVAAAERHSLDPDLLTAIVIVESSGNPFSMRFEPKWRYYFHVREFAERLRYPVQSETVAQAMSWGLGQVMGSVAREYGFGGFLSQLSVPAIGLEYSCLHLRKFLARYGEETPAVAAYNAGSARRLASGMYENQRYVDKVHRELVELRKLA